MSDLITNRDLPNKCISLKGNLDQHTVMQAWPTRVKDLAGFNDAVTLDLAAVEHIDTAGLAWVLSIKKQCQQQSLELNIENIPAAMTRLAKISDVESLLSLQ